MLLKSERSLCALSVVIS